MRALRYGSSRFARLIACIIAMAAATPKARIATHSSAIMSRLVRLSGVAVAIATVGDSGAPVAPTRSVTRMSAPLPLHTSDGDSTSSNIRPRNRSGGRRRSPLRPRHYAQLASHAVVADAAVLVADHQVLPGVVELGRELAHVA